MKSNQFWTAVSKAMAAVTVMLILTLVLASSAAAASQFKVVHVFTWAAEPTGDLIFDAAGNLYGTTKGGGAYGAGTVFKLKPNPDGTWTASILHSFRGADGLYPSGGLIFDAAGNLYGTTVTGGAAQWGVVFKLKSNSDGSWTESVLYNFTGTWADGGNPYAGLAMDAAGNLYGTAEEGGVGRGVVFELAPSSDGIWTVGVLVTFTDYAGGGRPYAGLTPDTAGNLYGTTSEGGPGQGAAFKLRGPHGFGHPFSVLYTFSGQADGGFPDAGLTPDAAGNVYGTTRYGGNLSCNRGLGCGVVFKLMPNPDGTWTERVLHTFSGGFDGAQPIADLALDAAGNLYGTTSKGGCGYGVVFKLAPKADGTWTETVLHTFVGYAKYPYGGVILDAAGNLYGTTSGGSNNYGLVFEITP